MVYLYRAVDAAGQTIDFLLSPRRDAAAARRFFRKALGQPHTGNPRAITVDKNAAYPIAVKAMKRAGELWRCAKLRQVKFLTDVFDKPFSIADSSFVFRHCPAVVRVQPLTVDWSAPGPDERRAGAAWIARAQTARAYRRVDWQGWFCYS
uniref:DDE-type integrase/transposase/recombinase n=1 Tax=Microvirga lotononidis TaxID=864069 RepID=UPI000A912D8A|nr:DDE-type integrase/transposase/recombinase [Microvirga lotononidis]